MYRFLYITNSDFVTYRIGQKRLFNVTLYGGLTLGILLVLALYWAVWNENNAGTFELKNCLIPDYDTIQILFDYENTSHGVNHDASTKYRWVKYMVFFIVLSANVIHMLVYAKLFCHLYQHDNTEDFVAYYDLMLLRQETGPMSLIYLVSFMPLLLRLQNGFFWLYGIRPI